MVKGYKKILDYLDDNHDELVKLVRDRCPEDFELQSDWSEESCMNRSCADCWRNALEKEYAL